MTSETTRKSPPPLLFGFLTLPYGLVMNGILGTVISFLLRAEGVGVPRISQIVAIVGLPGMLYFLWSPLTDFWLKRKNWLVLSAALSAGTLFAAFSVKDLGGTKAVVLLFVAAMFAMLTSACLGGLMGTVVPEEEKTTVSSYYQAGSLCAGALGGGGLLWLSQHLGWGRVRVAAVAAFFIAVPAMTAWLIDEPDVTAHVGGGLLRVKAMGKEFAATFFRWRSLPALLLLAAPAGSGAAINLLGGLAKDYGVNADQVAWVNGLASAILTAAGAMLVVLLPKRLDARIGYPAAGLLNAACLLVLVMGKLSPATYIVGAVLYMFSIGAAYALFTALVLQVMGDAGASGGSRYALLVSLGNFPVAYMAWVDGLGYKWWGPRGLPGIDMALSGGIAILFLIWFAFKGHGGEAREVA